MSSVHLSEPRPGVEPQTRKMCFQLEAQAALGLIQEWCKDRCEKACKDLNAELACLRRVDI